MQETTTTALIVVVAFNQVNSVSYNLHCKLCDCFISQLSNLVASYIHF